MEPPILQYDSRGPLNRVTIEPAPDGGVTIYIPKQKTDWQAHGGCLLALVVFSVIALALLLSRSFSLPPDGHRIGFLILAFMWLLIGLPVASRLLVYYRDRHEATVIAVSPKALYVRRPSWFSIR